MVQTITGQIVEQAVRERPEVRAVVDRHARELLPRIRELYPNGVDEEETRRIVALGQEPEDLTFRPAEVTTAVVLERKLATTLERSPHPGADWIDPIDNTTYDGVFGNMPAQHCSREGVRRSILDHVLKSVDRVVVDVRHLTKVQKTEIRDIVNLDLSAEQFAKIIILE